MKKFGFIVSAALCALICVSCNKELSPADPDIKDPGQSSVEKVHMSFTAGIGTKVSLSEGESSVDIVWSSDDHIAVWDGTEWCDFAATSVDGSSAVFEGEITPNDAFTTSDYIAVYPFAAIADPTQQAITIKVPDNQVVPEGGAVDPSALVSVATCSAEGLLSFEQVCALVKINLAEQDMSAITLEGTGLAGTATCATDGSISSVSDAAEKITLSAAAGTFAAGDYYIAALPATTTIKVGMVRESDGYTGVRSTASPVTLTQGSAKVYIKDSALNFEYNIYTPEQLLGCASHWAEAFKETVNILADLDMSDITWKAKNFAGHMKGNNHKFFNLSVKASEDPGFIRNLLGTVENLTFGSSDGTNYDGVSNVTLDNSSSGTGWTYAGLIIRIKTGAIIDNVKNYIPLIVTEETNVKHRIGGLVGTVTTAGGKISNSVNYGSITDKSTTITTAAASFIGGIVGEMDQTVTIENVDNRGNIECHNRFITSIGGIAGSVYGGSSISSCRNYGNIDCVGDLQLNGNLFIGGIAGNGASDYTNKSIFTDCENHGNITVGNTYNKALEVGGCFGWTRNANFINCDNFGSISSKHYQVNRLGGIVGSAHAASSFVNCDNSGSVTLAQSSANNNWQGIGGVAGFSEGAGPSFSGCTNRGVINVALNSGGSSYYRCAIGGIIGMPYTAATLSNNVNYANVSASNSHSSAPYCYVGGIIGQDSGASAASSISGNVNYGTISNNSDNSTYSAAGGLYGSIAVATSISGDKNFGSVLGVNAGAVAGVNSATISATLCDAVTVNGVTKADAANEATWLCPSNTGAITPTYVAHSDSE